MKQLIYCLLICLPTILAAQYSSLFMPRNMSKAFNTETRGIDGNPGKKYWQNKPEYKINLDFNPETTILNGYEEITYKNNSPDTLYQITITMLGDIYNKNNFNHDWNMNRKLVHDGIVLNKVEVNKKSIDINGKKIRRSGTNMFLTLKNPLLPNSSLEMSIDWKYEFPLKAVIRSGNYGDSTFMITYFFPKIAVYDDIDGWDTHNYTGFGEFYGEYADYDVNITVPGDFKVWATGELQNPEKVLSKEYLKRWKDAHKVGKTVNIINIDEVNKRDVTLQGDKLTWNYKAKHVTDFAFGTSNRFRWDARSIVVDKTTGRKVFMCTAYPKERVHYPRIIELLDTVITNFSTQMPGIPYPYPSMKIFNGNAGMEFPMMCNDSESREWLWNVGLTYHEVAHTYFPFFVGTNERKHAWMDEGWATFFPNFYMDKHIDKTKFNYFKSRMETYNQFAGNDLEVPSMVLVDLLRLRAPYRQASYNKSFLAYYYLYDYLGEDRFLTALRGYMNDWGGKHPIPYDFFNSFNRLSGENLDWFWENWFLDFGYGDMGISLKDKNTLEINNFGHLALPIKLTITYKDDNEVTMEYNMKIWKNAKNRILFPIPRADEVKSIKLGDEMIIDVDKSNNVIVF